MEKTKNEKEIMEKFLKMLEADKEKAPALYKFLNRIIYDLFDLGEQGYQPTFSFTIFTKFSKTEDKLELLFRPIRTPDTQVYEGFQLEKLGELINEALEKYGREVWGMIPMDERKTIDW